MKRYFSNLAETSRGVILGLLILGLLAGCADTPRWGAWSRHPTPAQIQAVLDRLDNYVYFPSYEIYYNTAKDRYTFRSDRSWVTRNEPPGEVSVELLQDSPSVALNFNDAPERHHAEVRQSYPRNWGRTEATMVSAR